MRKLGFGILLSAALALSPTTALAAPTAPAPTAAVVPQTVQVYQTVKGGAMDQRLADLQLQPFNAAADTQKTVRIYPGDKRQEMLGIGGAMTESSAYNISLLAPEKQREIYDAYFTEGGANYSVIRTSIGSADFSVKSYSYNDTPTPDPLLNNFSLGADYDYVIPAIKRIQSYRPDVKLFAAPWAPPAWMKKSGVRRGQTGTAGLSLIDNSVKPEYYESYANYFVKYLQAYAAEGIDVFSLSMQNEAQNNPKWEAATWSINDTIDFVANHLGPALERNNLDPELLIWDWDKGNDSMHRDGFINYNLGVLANPQAKKYIDGIAFHWYAGDIWHEIAGIPMWSRDFYSLDRVRAAHPEIKLYATEGTQEKGPWMYSFDPADRYIYDIINDFEHGTSTWIDWNLVLDHQGGPTQGVVNQCHAPIMLDANHNIVYNPSYYILKRFSQEIQPGSVSVRTEANFTGIEKTAVLKENGQTSVFLGNVSDTTHTVNVVNSGKMVKVSLPAHSMTTLVFPPLQAERVLQAAGVSSSSYEWHPWMNYSPWAAIDGNRGSRWASDWRDREHITFDAGTTRVLSGLNLSFENGQDAAFEIQASADGRNFVTVAQVAKGTYRQQKQVTVQFPPVSARYLRFQGISRANRYGYSLWEASLIGF